MTETKDRTEQKTRKLTAIKIAVIAIVVIVAIGQTRKATDCVTGRCASYASIYDDKISELEKTDPRLIGYREVQTIQTGLQEPRAIALDKSGNIIIAGDYAIRKFAPSGKSLRDIRTSEKPTCLAVAADGTLYVGMKHHIEVYALKGERTAVWKSAGDKAYFTSIAVTASDVWVADSANRQVTRYNTSGTATGIFARKEPEKNAPGLLVPSPYVDLAATADGGIWVSDPGRHRLELYASDGRLKRYWGKYSFAVDGFSGCCNPTNFAIMPDGRFVTSEKGIPRVKVYSSAGSFLSVVAGREAFAPETAGLDIAVESKGRILVLDSSNKTIRIFAEMKKAKK